MDLAQSVSDQGDGGFANDGLQLNVQASHVLHTGRNKVMLGGAIGKIAHAALSRLIFRADLL